MSTLAKVCGAVTFGVLYLAVEILRAVFFPTLRD